ncbi:hypothetical protein MMC11_004617 [Xylographa trunciseda]|nr:hypothetical protein [Xylographa trunciseda]
MDVATSQIVSQPFSLWAGDDGSWGSFLIHTGAPAVAQIASALTTSCYDPEHRWKKTQYGSLDLRNQSLLSFDAHAEQPPSSIGHETSDIEDLARLRWTYNNIDTNPNITSLQFTWTQSYCGSLPGPLQDPSPFIYAIAFIAFALAATNLYDGFSVRWREKLLPVLALGTVVAAFTSIATSETFGPHSIVWLVSPVTTGILVLGVMIDGIGSRIYKRPQSSITKNGKLNHWAEKG